VDRRSAAKTAAPKGSAMIAALSLRDASHSVEQTLSKFGLRR
jgi:hypothetical protein